jgi:hypothetical protein
MNLDEYYSRSVEKLNKVMFTSFQTQLTFYRHLILVASTFLGILIAFHPSGATPPCTRWAFLAAVIALTLGILALSIVLHAYTALLKKFYQSFRTELQRAALARDIMKDVPFDIPEIVKILVPISYFLFIIALVLLITYTILILG